jgi:hypothetical protein
VAIDCPSSSPCRVVQEAGAGGRWQPCTPVQGCCWRRAHRMTSLPPVGAHRHGVHGVSAAHRSCVAPMVTHRHTARATPVAAAGEGVVASNSHVKDGEERAPLPGAGGRINARRCEPWRGYLVPRSMLDFDHGKGGRAGVVRVRLASREGRP